MPKEKSIAKRLSGGEALDSLMHRVYVELSRQVKEPTQIDPFLRQMYTRLCAHGHFHSHKAYHGYSATVDLKLEGPDVTVKLEFRPAMSFSPPLTDEFVVKDAGLGFVIGAVEMRVNIPVRPPNAVREESGMDMPVQVEENGVLVEKMVPAARYKTKLRPGQKGPRVANMDVPAFQGKFDVPDDVVADYGVQSR
jgi:hypothetical protein